MQLGIKEFGTPFTPINELNSGTAAHIRAVIFGDVEDHLRIVVEDNGLLFTISYYSATSHHKVNELIDLTYKLERP